MSLGNPNVTLTIDGLPLAYAPTKDLGTYVYEGSTPQAPDWLINRSTISPDKTRFVAESRWTLPANANYPEKVARVYVVMEIPDHDGVTSDAARLKLQGLSSLLTTANIDRLRRGEV